MTKVRTYSELRRLETFEDRYHYLELKGVLGETTFGFDRWVNQSFYKSWEWKSARNQVIIRDHGCDLGIPGYEIYSGLIVHHMNPMSLDDIEHGEEWIIDPNFLITTSLQTHNAIHYGDESLLPRGPVVRERGDTTLW
jgi:acetyltransferase-like isoleucine patch superfamily enzyme